MFDVELDHERNRRQRKSCQHVEITARGRGPVVRGEACADSFYAALESAVAKLESPTAPGQGPPQDPLRRQEPGITGRGHRDRPQLEQAFDASTAQVARHPTAPTATITNPGRVVRIKEHPPSR